jgi:NCAIR mutase (PurE)-related protein
MTTSKHVLIEDKLFLDLDRQNRTLVPEVIYAPNKSNEDLELAIKVFIEEKSSVFISRLNISQINFLKEKINILNFNERAGTAFYGNRSVGIVGKVSLVSGGTSDLNVLEEARDFLNYLGIENKVYSDYGVASLGRLLSSIDEIDSADIILVFAGMEGALPSVLCGLTKIPVIGIPVSNGYGVSAGGFSALMSMLSSCSPGLLTVNIDNGIGAVAAAIKILAIKGK